MHGFSDLTSATSVTCVFHGYEQWNGYSKPVSHCQIQITVKIFFFEEGNKRDSSNCNVSVHVPFPVTFLFLFLFALTLQN